MFFWRAKYRTIAKPSRPPKMTHVQFIWANVGLGAGGKNICGFDVRTMASGLATRATYDDESKAGPAERNDVDRNAPAAKGEWRRRQRSVDSAQENSSNREHVTRQDERGAER